MRNKWLLVLLALIIVSWSTPVFAAKQATDVKPNQKTSSEFEATTVTKSEDSSVTTQKKTSEKKVKQAPDAKPAQKDSSENLSSKLKTTSIVPKSEELPAPAQKKPNEKYDLSFVPKSVLQNEKLFVLVNTHPTDRTVKLFDKPTDEWKMEKNYLACVGKNDCTPIGVFRIIDKDPAPWWNPVNRSLVPPWENVPVPPGNKYNMLGSRWMEFLPSYGIHGTPEQVLFTIGDAASSGCVGLSNPNAEELFDLVHVGTVVVIINAEI